MNISSPPDIADTFSSHKHTWYLSVITACLKYYVFFLQISEVVHGLYVTWARPGRAYPIQKFEIHIYIYIYLYIYIYIYLFKKRYFDLSSRNFSWWKKILFFIFVLFFFRSSSPSPSWVKKKNNNNNKSYCGDLEHAGSLSIRRFWGKGERWKRKKERAFSSPPSPSPISNLLSPSPLGRPGTQASMQVSRQSGYQRQSTSLAEFIALMKQGMKR